MTNEERAKALASMPKDFKPTVESDFMPVYFEYRRPFSRLSDEQAGRVMKHLLEYAYEYSKSYDNSLEPNIDGLDGQGEMLLDLMAASIRRVYDRRRETAFLRSGLNGGGRPDGDKT